MKETKFGLSALLYYDPIDCIQPYGGAVCNPCNGVKKFMHINSRYIIMSAVMAMTASMPLSAETVSQKEAARLASAFFNAAHGQVMAKPTLVYNGRRLTTDRLFAPFYVYNLGKGGFVIISAENKAFPILGYSLKENFNPEAMGDALKALLTEYARDIEFIRYDSRIPEEAIAAWNDFPSYVDNLLSAQYSATDPDISIDDAAARIDDIVYSDRSNDLSSDIFSPGQWSTMMNDELLQSGSVALGVISDGTVRPMVVHGSKGDYYRIKFDESQTNDWLMRLMATEFLTSGQVADYGHPIIIENESEEEAPFSFYDSFMADMAADRESVTRSIEERLHPSSPVVQSVGGGHFRITLPEEVSLVRVYSLSGSMVERLQYKNTDSAVISLDGLPYGFYFALANGVSGKSYGFKLCR